MAHALTANETFKPHCPSLYPLMDQRAVELITLDSPMESGLLLAPDHVGVADEHFAQSVSAVPTLPSPSESRAATSGPSSFPRAVRHVTIHGTIMEHDSMSHIVDATYENGVLKLDRPLPLKDHERVRVTVEALARKPHSVLDIRPISLGQVLSPLTSDDDLLGEMLEGRG